ncbi:hypothetical protein F2Q69_00013208, partial [Brassica cretica]
MFFQIIEEFQKFYLDHPFGKFFGDCTELKVKLDRCFRRGVNFKSAIPQHLAEMVIDLETFEQHPWGYEAVIDLVFCIKGITPERLSKESYSINGFIQDDLFCCSCNSYVCDMFFQIIEEFQKFYLDHPFGKFFGDCTELKVKLDRCFRR